MYNNTTAVLSIGAVVVALALLGTFFFMRSGTPEAKPPVVVNSFAECEKAGYPVMESYPRQCRVPGGALFVEAVVGLDVNASTTGDVLGDSIDLNAFSGK